MAVASSSNSPTVLDLFCGCGGLSYGFQEAGFQVLLGIDNDKAAIGTFLNTHQGSQAICGDITTLEKEDIIKLIGQRKIDVIVGGPPCQGMSLSGPRNFDDPRNSLYLSFIRMVEIFKPRAVVVENVPGMLSLFGGQIKDAIIDRFQELGYNINLKILRSSDFGVPQHRKRVFIVGLRGGYFEFPRPTHFSLEEALMKGGQKMVTTREAIDDLPLLDTEYCLGSEEQDYITVATNVYQEMMRSKSNRVYNHIAANHSLHVRETIKFVPPGGNYKNLPEEIKSTRQFNVAWTRFPDDQPSPTIDTGHRHHFHYLANRVPTVRECARLQSFPDHFIFQGNKTEQFRQVGNAVPPLLAKVIALRLKEYLNV